jgi:uncharacterized delta-60 repeat protein
LIDILECRRLLSGGDLDTSFGDHGITSTNFPGAPLRILDIAVQPNGKIVLAGTKSGNVAAARLNADGTLDSTFGSGGLHESSLPESSKLQVLVQADNKPIIAYPGSLVFGIPAQVIRLTSGGSPDPGFGTGGAVHLPLSASLPDLAMALQLDQKIVVAGQDQDAQDTDFGIVRLNADGSPDSQFGNLGLANVDFGDHERAIALAIDQNGTPASNPLWGSIVAVGGTGSQGHNIATIKICRLTPQGSLDKSLDGDGMLTSPQLSPAEYDNPAGVLIQPGGKIVVAASAVTAAGEGDFLAARYLSSGQIDTTFGLSGSGIVQTDLGNFSGDDVALKLAPSFMGGFLIGGRQNTLGAVAAYTPDGVPDTRFSGDGWFQTSLGPQTSIAVTGATIAPLRRLVLAGGTRVARFIDLGPKVGLLNINSVTSEATQATLGVIVVTERMPTEQRVYIDIGGTATMPGLGLPSNWDYSTSDLTLIGFNNPRNYVTIPANSTFASFSITPIDDTRAEGDETIAIRVSPDSTYDIDGVPITLAIRDNDVIGGPTVTSAFVYDSGPPQRVQFTFNQNVSTSIGAGDFNVAGPAGAVPFSFAYNDVTNTATLSFSSVIPDGDYTATAVASGITNSGGTPMAANHVLPFFFLSGDANHDRRVDVADLGVLASNWQQSPRTFSQGNFDYSADGLVDVADLGILASSWQKELAEPSAPAERSRGGRTAMRRIAAEVL